jgi:hypothetical protein
VPTTGHCSDKWRFFAGGFIFKGKRCTALHVRIGERTRDVLYGLDKPCAPSAKAATSWRDLHRPLDLPAVAPGTACPTSSVDERVDWEAANIFGGSGIGPGPAYPGLGSPPVGELRVEPDRRSAWYGSKVFWYVKPSYRDRVLIRGARLDGAGEMRFSEVGQRRSRELRIGVRDTVQWDGQPRHSRGVPSDVFASGAGCYGVQIDGANFSRTVGFAVTTSP